MTMRDQDLSRLDRHIGRLLRVGVSIVVTLLAVGLALDAAGIAASRRVLQCALVILLFIPGSRVVASFIDALRSRDRLLALSTGIVITILVWQWVTG